MTPKLNTAYIDSMRTFDDWTDLAERRSHAWNSEQSLESIRLTRCKIAFHGASKNYDIVQFSSDFPVATKLQGKYVDTPGK